MLRKDTMAYSKNNYILIYITNNFKITSLLSSVTSPTSQSHITNITVSHHQHHSVTSPTS